MNLCSRQIPQYHELEREAVGGSNMIISDQTGLVNKSQRLIIKIGSALLVDSDTGEIRYNWLEKMADDIANLRSRNKEVIIVSSGAVAFGSRHLGHSC